MTIARIDLPGAWMWSQWQPARGMNFNSYAFERDGSCVVVDPLEADDGIVAALQERGGVSTIVLTNRDHERGAAALRERFGARVLAHAPEAASFALPVDTTFADGDEVFPGAFAVALPHGKTGGEVALHVPEAKAAIVGDALIGAPAGAVSLLADDMLADPRRFLFALRRLWALQLQTLLLCDGQPLFGNADAAVARLLDERLGAELYRINAADVRYRKSGPRGTFSCEDGEVGLLVGSRKLGYRLAKVPPGYAFCPLHWHVASEEFFYVLEGHPTVRTPRGNLECRPGDFIAFPTGERGAHQLRNDSSEGCTVLLAGIEEAGLDMEACFYPDSDKIGLWTVDGPLRMVAGSPHLDYFHGE